VETIYLPKDAFRPFGCKLADGVPYPPCSARCYQKTLHKVQGGSPVVLTGFFSIHNSSYEVGLENIPCTKACFHIQIIINKLCSCSSLSRQVCELGTFSWSEWEYRIEQLVISRYHCSGPDTRFNTCLAFILHEHVNNVCNNSCCIR